MSRVIKATDKIQWTGGPLQLALFDLRPHDVRTDTMGDSNRKIIRMPEMMKLAGRTANTIRDAIKRKEFYAWKKHRCWQAFEDVFLSWLAQPDMTSAVANIDEPLVKKQKVG